MSSPTQRTLKWIRDQGYKAQVVERWNPYARVRIDLFGFIDIVAIHPNVTGTLGIQATSASGGNLKNRLRKIRGLEESKLWMQAGNQIWVVGWRKIMVPNKKGIKRKQWAPRVLDLSEEEETVVKYGMMTPQSSIKYTCVFCGAVHHWKFIKCSRCREKNPNLTPVIALTALMQAMKGTPGSEMRRYLLLTTLREKPFLIRLLRVAFSQELDLEFTSEDVIRAAPSAEQYNVEEILADRIKGRITPKEAAGRWKTLIRDLGDPYKDVLNALVDKRLNIGLNLKGINRVLRKMGEREISGG